MAEVAALLLLSGTLLFGLMFHAVTQHGSRVAKLSTRPSFIVILADDIGWGDLGANQLGRMANNTPHLDLMCQQGMRSIYLPPHT